MQETSTRDIRMSGAEGHSESPAGRVCDDRITVYFDGSCPLCSLEIRHYNRLKGSENLALVDVATDSEDPGPDLSSAEAMKRLYVRLPDGQLVSGARAFAAIWSRVSAWRWAAGVAKVPGVMFLLEIAYRAFLPVRPLLSWLAARLGARSHQA